MPGGGMGIAWPPPKEIRMELDLPARRRVDSQRRRAAS